MTESPYMATGVGAENAGAASHVEDCFHCGTPCRTGVFASDQHSFCCRGCQTVFEILTENGLSDFYQLAENAGVRVKPGAGEDQYRHLDAPAVLQRLVDFSNDQITRVTFRVPAIHCIACVWLLENLFHLKPGIGHSQVHFPRKEIALSFQTGRIKLSEVVGLLASLGYEPELKLSDLDKESARPGDRRLWMQLGVAGFAFGNTMLFSISSYLGLDSWSRPVLERIFGCISLALAIPVLFYSAADYWKSAWLSARRRMVTIEVPIVLGIAALFVQSTVEVLSGRGPGYFDSLCGLLFFLLCGKWFQQKTYDRLAFDRDYKSFFPLTAIRETEGRQEQAALSELRAGDRLIIRNGELIPADARLIEGPALIDYSFVTGESEPAERRAGDRLYAGGRQIGGAITVEMTRAVSQSYLTSLWNQEVFRKERGNSLDTLTNRYSRRFTVAVLAVAVAAAVFWGFHEPARAVRSFVSVLIVACPCALALAAPFALGTAQRVLARRQVFLKNPAILETLAQVDAVVFDKTGTLTAAGAGSILFHGAPLTDAEARKLYSLTRHSTHPLAARVGEVVSGEHDPLPVRSFSETAGCGMEGIVAGQEIWMGSAAWLASRGAQPPRPAGLLGAAVHIAITGQYRGCFALTSALRPETGQLVANLACEYELALLSGDNEKERGQFTRLFGASAHLRFNQSPLNKLGFIREFQNSGRTVMMVGDGLNDAGALRQSNVGVAVVENINSFSPASDVIMAAAMVPRLQSVLRFARRSVRIVRASFLISSVYNIVGISIAARGLLSPVICAILMPLSSVTVFAFACGLTAWMGNRAGLEPVAAASASAEARDRRVWEKQIAPKEVAA